MEAPGSFNEVKQGNSENSKQYAIMSTMHLKQTTLETTLKTNHYSPNKVFTVAAESGMFEESRNEFVVFDFRDVLFLESSFPCP